ncbi:protein TolR [Alloalcanivorax gelatiniphagus]|uniref:Tol-Pal system protein TolR n=1 Tax=Alloalcanivorax gelatiniphagus TaxID=1194167 RepID=A0ABY2XQ45_9GAMM|nr:protein TolR [Alloalcanivorax gelatiniphagus]TMW14792.1 protein TolR [Alloalcanivorax gelatiniphagus]|tara:strand:+ start:3892 stop:4326 length:435 start_codon:yes stop_codon:yes gene_type:complete
MSGIRVRKPRKMMADINVVPYIDVMLVLLVIFMATAPMMTQGVSVDLPQADSAPILNNEEPVMITVRADGSYHINVGEDGGQTASSLETVKGHVLTIRKQKPKTLFLVEGDQNVAYGKVVVLMSELQRAGVTNVGLVTEPPGRS